MEKKLRSKPSGNSWQCLPYSSYSKNPLKVAYNQLLRKSSQFMVLSLYLLFNKQQLTFSLINLDCTKKLKREK